MNILIDSQLRLADVPGELRQSIVERLTFENPKWLENERYSRWQGNTSQYLRFFEDLGDTLVTPRGFARQLLQMCKRHGAHYHLEDKRHTLPEVDSRFQGQLRPFQTEAVEAVLCRDFGTLSAPTGSGKTVMALSVIAHRKQPALIVVHTKELLEQWISRIESFLGIPASHVGRIGGGKQIIGNEITVALVQSLYKCAEEVAPYIGHLVVDECHRTPSRTFTEATTAFDCKFMLGLSATPWRRDKLSKLIFWHVGDVAHEIEKKNLIETGDVLPADVIVRHTDFEPYHDPSIEYTKMLSELTEDRQRNLLIVQDVAQEARNSNGGVCLILSDRKTHCEAIQGLLAEMAVKSELLTGDLGNAQRRRVVEDLNTGKIKVLVATGQLIGEGFDCKELSTLFLATPIKFSGRLIQYLGRVLRPAPGKDRARVFDYVDKKVGVLVAAAKTRRSVYTGRENG